MSHVGILNWSAVRGSNTDFNANSRVTQGGCGFASADFDRRWMMPPDQCTNDNLLTPVNPAIYDHGITQGASEALDVQTLSILFAVRPLNQPQPSNGGVAGRTVFAPNCASCHGGAEWTKSQIFHRDNPAVVAQNGPPFDPGVTRFEVTDRGDHWRTSSSRSRATVSPSGISIRWGPSMSTILWSSATTPPPARRLGWMASTRRRYSALTITRRTCTAAKPKPSTRCSRCMGWGGGGDDCRRS